MTVSEQCRLRASGRVSKPATVPRREVRRVLQEGSRLVGEWLTVYVAPGTGATRVAFLCGRGVGEAVERNRARRLLREAWRQAGGAVPEGADVVVVARPAMRGAKAGEVARDLARTVSRGGVLERPWGSRGG